jgi:nucleoside-diphosphate-sugar epimerase
VEKIGKLVGHKLEVQQESERMRRAGSEVERLISNNSKARSLMEWAPKVDLDAGLALTLEHIRKYPQDYQPRGYVV